MIGSIIGDVIGSQYEFTYNLQKDVKILDSDHPEGYDFTDDSVMSLAVAEGILSGYNSSPAVLYKTFGRAYPNRGYGGMFGRWIYMDSTAPYNSYGNGAAMRINPVGFLPLNIKHKFEISDHFTSATHNHPESIKAARCVVDVMHRLLFDRATKDDIKFYVSNNYGYNVDLTVTDYRLKEAHSPGSNWVEHCMGTIPQALVCFLDSEDFMDSIRNAISIGADADTVACITGGFSECYYRHIPVEVVDFVGSKLDDKLLGILNRFEDKYGCYNK